jgi:2-amino-4-hydroxy-6-hydroxymethyldihydropteridine diphosphokinase
METIALALGGNQGDVSAHFSDAICKLEKSGLQNICTSSCYVTTPVGCKEDAPDFVNAALTGEWNGTPAELLALCKRLEAEAGRPSEYERNSDRPLDLDIILFGEQTYQLDNLTVPHIDMENRLFVLIPLAEVAPNMTHPVLNKSVKELLTSIDDPEEFTKIMSGKTSF